VTSGSDFPAGPTTAEKRAGAAAFEQAKAKEPRDDQLPEVDFQMFVLSLNHSALVHLGDAPNPSDDSVEVNLSLARQTIDLLALMQEKTRGNLSGDEERLLDQALYDLRMRYLEVSKTR
jgi:hypothetical protein